MFGTDIDTRALQRGSFEMVVLALLESRERHGYELAKLIDSGSDSHLQFHVASLYPLLYRLERKGLVHGRWVEKAGERRRRFYRLTPLGRKTLARHRETWRAFVKALNRIAGFSHA
jgi:PadR family transcriptional regulator PadR